MEEFNNQVERTYIEISLGLGSTDAGPVGP